MIHFFNWLANWPQNDKGPGNLTLVTSELRGVWGRFYFQELVSNLFSLWILSDSIIQFLFFFRTLRLALLFCNGEGEFMFNFQNGTVCAHERCRKNMKMDLWAFLQIIKNKNFNMNVAGKIWKWTCVFCGLSKTEKSAWNGLGSWMLQKNIEINFLRVIKKINTPHIKRKARMLQW